MFQLTARSLILAAAVTGALAQTFDVATVKPNRENDYHFLMRPALTGSLTATGVTLKFLISQIYKVRDYQVSGGSGWIGSDRWDIHAKAEGVAGRLSVEQYQTMLKTLLADRFQLKVHSETRELPIYALLIGKNGSKLIPQGEPRSPETDGSSRGRFRYGRSTTAFLARMLSGVLRRPVVDMTGLKGLYDFKLDWAPEPGENAMEALGLPPQPEALPPVDNSKPSIFSAVQEQLGLRLESRKGPVEIIVIDHAERPSEN